VVFVGAARAASYSKITGSLGNLASLPELEFKAFNECDKPRQVPRIHSPALHFIDGQLGAHPASWARELIPAVLTLTLQVPSQVGRWSPPLSVRGRGWQSSKQASVGASVQRPWISGASPARAIGGPAQLSRDLTPESARRRRVSSELSDIFAEYVRLCAAAAYRTTDWADQGSRYAPCAQATVA
jgi:hypothetical protein